MWDNTHLVGEASPTAEALPMLGMMEHVVVIACIKHSAAATAAVCFWRKANNLMLTHGQCLCIYKRRRTIGAKNLNVSGGGKPTRRHFGSLLERFFRFTIWYRCIVVISQGVRWFAFISFCSHWLTVAVYDDRQSSTFERQRIGSHAELGTFFLLYSLPR